MQSLVSARALVNGTKLIGVAELVVFRSVVAIIGDWAGKALSGLDEKQALQLNGHRGCGWLREILKVGSRAESACNAVGERLTCRAAFLLAQAVNGVHDISYSIAVSLVFYLTVSYVNCRDWYLDSVRWENKRVVVARHTRDVLVRVAVPVPVCLCQ
jgi:hypothetical protein